MENSPSHAHALAVGSLHHCHVHQLRAILNISFSLVYFLALTAIFYDRSGALLFILTKPTDDNTTYSCYSFLLCLILFAAEFLFSFLWTIKQPLYWRPVTRTVFPENLPKDDQLPGIDVFICTADPIKEPTFEVMNTVISAMSLDYPADKLSVYLSDDGGASVTLNGMKEAWVFATWWLPFCRRYNVTAICPQAYFQNAHHPEEIGQTHTMEFIQHRDLLQEKYKALKQRLGNSTKRGELHDKTTSCDHSPVVQVINESSIENDAGAATLNPEAVKMPLLVYVAREKRPSHPHCFKAGALNALLRVSSILSNSPYVLVLDCDMYCNDSISARQAMCFHLDPKISPSLGWVQYPQKFHNVCDTDIYDSQMRTVWPVYWPGADGLKGPCITGTNCYIKRKALYGISINTGEGINLKELRDSLGPSNELIKSISHNDKLNAVKGRDMSSDLVQEAHFLASCTYEKGTSWGQKVGFRYGTIVEDMATSIILQSRGWRSVYLNPTRPQFLGSATTSLNEMLVQGIRWYGGLADLCLSQYCPLIYRPSKMPILQKLFFSWMESMPFESLPVLCFAFILPMCLLYGIPVYPKLSDPRFIAFAFVFVSCQLKHLCDMVVISGGSTTAWLNEQRMWMAKCLSCFPYGILRCVMTKLGLQEATFTPTNKVEDDDTTKLYQMGIYDFRTSYMFLVPIATAVILNVWCFVGGVARLIVSKDWDVMFAQMCFSFYVLVMSFPVIEGMLLRKDNARIPLPATIISTVLSLFFLCLGYLILLH